MKNEGFRFFDTRRRKMKSFTQVIGGIVVCFFFVFVSVCSAQLSDLEQRALHQEAAKLAKEIGVGENDMYRNLAFLHMSKQSRRIAEHATNSVEIKHQNLRSDLYESAADASLKVVFLIGKGKQLIVDLQEEQATTDGKIVSPELSHRINAFGSATTDALLTAAKMSRQMVELASFEAEQGCQTEKSGYVVHCTEELKKAVHDIEIAMTVLEKAVKPFEDAVMLGVTKHFTY